MERGEDTTLEMTKIAVRGFLQARGPAGIPVLLTLVAHEIAANIPDEPISKSVSPISTPMTDIERRGLSRRDTSNPSLKPAIRSIMERELISEEEMNKDLYSLRSTPNTSPKIVRFSESPHIKPALRPTRSRRSSLSKVFPQSSVGAGVMEIDTQSGIQTIANDPITENTPFSFEPPQQLKRSLEEEPKDGTRGKKGKYVK